MKEGRHAVGPRCYGSWSALLWTAICAVRGRKCSWSTLQAARAWRFCASISLSNVERAHKEAHNTVGQEQDEQKRVHFDKVASCVSCVVASCVELVGGDVSETVACFFWPPKEEIAETSSSWCRDEKPLSN